MAARFPGAVGIRDDYTVVRPAFFVTLHLQDPSLQCFQLNRSQSVFLIGRRACRHQNVQSPPYPLRQVMVISLVLIRICPNIPVELTSSGCGSVPRFLSNSISTRFESSDWSFFGLLTCGRCRLSVSAVGLAGFHTPIQSGPRQDR